MIINARKVALFLLIHCEKKEKTLIRICIRIPICNPETARICIAPVFAKASFVELSNPSLSPNTNAWAKFNSSPESTSESEYDN